jgi:hypothetical protein
VKLRIASMALAALAFAAPAAHANLLVNGSFENGNFQDNTGGDAMLLQQGATNMTGWTVVGGGNLLWAGPNSYSYMGGLSAEDGGYFLDLTGLTNTSPYAGVEQTVGTNLGTQYQLSFNLGGRGDGLPVGIEVKINGTLVQNFVSSTAAWTYESLKFFGTGGATKIDLIGSQSGTDNTGFDISLDDVTLIAVPEPGTLALLGVGLVGAGVIRRRRKKESTA